MVRLEDQPIVAPVNGIHLSTFQETYGGHTEASWGTWKIGSDGRESK